MVEQIIDIVKENISHASIQNIYLNNMPFKDFLNETTNKHEQISY